MKIIIRMQEPKTTLSVRMKIGGLVIQEYEGKYIVTPSGEIQVLETSQKKMLDDVTILAIPYSETINLAGGKTANIGS